MREDFYEIIIILFREEQKQNTKSKFSYLSVFMKIVFCMANGDFTTLSITQIFFWKLKLWYH